MSEREKNNRSFLIVDDDEISNVITSRIIQNSCVDAEIMTFVNPVAALEYLRKDFAADYSKSGEVILLLNLTMPVLTGWEFLSEFETLPGKTKDRFRVYILSASVDFRDEQRSQTSKYVRGFLRKPLTTEAVLGLIRK